MICMYLYLHMDFLGSTVLVLVPDSELSFMGLLVSSWLEILSVISISVGFWSALFPSFSSSELGEFLLEGFSFEAMFVISKSMREGEGSHLHRFLILKMEMETISKNLKHSEPFLCTLQEMIYFLS